MKPEKLLLLLLLTFLITINYSSLDEFLIKTFKDYETGTVTRIIDGDTIKIGDESIRLLGINSPEKGEPFSEESTNFLEEKILNKEVTIYFGKEKYDLYGRKLGYIFYKNQNINLESVKNGYSNFYFPSGKDKHYNEFKEAWENCLNSNINLCKQIINPCLKITWLPKEDKTILKNSCNFSFSLQGYTIKDEGRKKLTLNSTLSPRNSITLTSESWGENYIWTKTGDSIFIRDEKNNLIFWDTY